MEFISTSSMVDHRPTATRLQGSCRISIIKPSHLAMAEPSISVERYRLFYHALIHAPRKGTRQESGCCLVFHMCHGVFVPVSSFGAAAGLSRMDGYCSVNSAGLESSPGISCSRPSAVLLFSVAALSARSTWERTHVRQAYLPK